MEKVKFSIHKKHEVDNIALLKGNNKGEKAVFVRYYAKHTNNDLTDKWLAELLYKFILCCREQDVISLGAPCICCVCT